MLIKDKSGIKFIAILFAALFASGLMLQAVNADARPGRHKRGGVKRFYHPRGHNVTVLPRGHRHLWFGGMKYFFSHGLFYRAARTGFVVVAAPIGAIVTVLPAGFNTILLEGAPHYFYNGIYYRKAPRGFVVVEPPPGAAVK